jgi:hypothetical protein
MLMTFETAGADSDLDELEAKLVETFDIKRTAPDAPFVGLQRAHDAISRAIPLHQQCYTEELLEECGMQDAKSTSTPIEPGVELR